MSNSLYTNSDKQKGFVFSLDAILAILIVTGLIGFALITSFDKNPSTISRTNISQLSDDAITALDNSGYVQNEIDVNGFSSGAALNIYNKIKALFPGNVDLNILLKQYDLNTTTCKASPNFQNCFNDANILSLSAGSIIPSSKEIVHGKRVFSKREPPSQCLLSSFAEKKEISKKYSGPLYLAGEVPIDFNVTVVPSSQISCDQNVFITLSVGIGSSARKPVDIATVIDRSGSMDECAVADGNVLLQQSGQISGGTIGGGGARNNWVQIATFNNTVQLPFDVLVTNNIPCTTNCPELYIRRPNGTLYGFYNGSPGSNSCYDSSSQANYILVQQNRAQIGLWQIWAWNDNPAMDYNLTIKRVAGKITKMTAAKNAAITFVNSAKWQLPPDQLALISYSSSATVNQRLTTNKNLVINAINSLSANGSTATGEGIYSATGELTSVRANSAALKFQVLMSDGQTNTGRSSSGAATDAKNKNIKIYTIGFGPDADGTELSNIANITGGQYYYAQDANTLQAIYDLIAQDIALQANDANITVPIQSGGVVINLGGGSIIDGNLFFDINTLTQGTNWNATYVVNFPCNNANNCSFSALTFPGPGTFLTYTDSNGTHVVDWNEFVTVPYKYRDLDVNFVSGSIISQNSVSLDVNAANIGDLNTPATNIKFYLNDPDAGGTFLDQVPISALCGGKDISCITSYQLVNDALSTQGTIYATINDDNAIRECPGNNKDFINCYGEPATRYYSIDYYAWWR